MSSVFGVLFRVATFGESHGRAVGCVVDGCPPRLPLSEADLQAALDRRRPGQSDLSTPRDEADRVAIVSGVQDGLTLGTPIAMLVENRDMRPADYTAAVDVPRPSHADFTYAAKYGLRTRSGGGRASARETIGRVAAGAIAEQFLRTRFGVEIVAWACVVGTREAPDRVNSPPTRAAVDAFSTRAPDAESEAAFRGEIKAARAERDSVGGVVACVCRGAPAGWGEPVFGKLEAELARAMLSIPAAKGFEYGSGFAGARMRGSAHNDLFVAEGGRLRTASNRSGGIQGGISNGEDIVFRVAFKPPATIGRPQTTATYEGGKTVLEMRGRHDPCVVPRAVPVVEAMAALVLADAALQQLARERGEAASSP
jgi:chorismate synthase